MFYLLFIIPLPFNTPESYNLRTTYCVISRQRKLFENGGLVMLKTKEDIKKAVLDYLVNHPRKTKQVEEYTASRISEIIKADTSKVEEAIAELEEENLVDSRKVQLDVYVPKTEEGFEALTSFARRGYIAYSPYWAVAFGFGLLFIGVLILGNYLGLPAQVNTLSESYLMGIRYGIIGSFVAGLLGGVVIQNALSKFRRWQIVSEEIYETISSLVKYIIYLFVPFVLVYYIASKQLGYSFELGIVVTLLSIAIATAIGYKQLVKRKKVDMS